VGGQGQVGKITTKTKIKGQQPIFFYYAPLLVNAVVGTE
jgi:hypothetical protein